MIKQRSFLKVQLIVILVKPEYQINIGAVARAIKNFGLTELRLVKPKAKIGFTAKMYAKHSEEILKDAKKFRTLAEATQDCDVIIGTTAAPKRFRKMVKSCVTMEQARKIAGDRKIALVFGPEGNGLSEEDTGLCDILAHIPAPGSHAVMNLSHAVAVALYEFTRDSCKQTKYFNPAPAEKRRFLEKMFGEIIQNQERVRDKRKVALAFRRVLERANIADDEMQALLAAFSSILKKTGKGNKISC